MKKFALCSFCALMILQACQTSGTKTRPQDDVNTPPASDMIALNATQYSIPIPIDTANRMIQSYLTGVSIPPNTTFLKSLTFNADTLRSYINDTSGGKIVSVKLMLAHNLTWINSGHYGQNGSTKAAALTLVLVGLDRNGRYIYNRNNMVYEHMQPCPPQCPANSQNLLTQ